MSGVRVETESETGEGREKFLSPHALRACDAHALRAKKSLRRFAPCKPNFETKNRGCFAVYRSIKNWKDYHWQMTTDLPSIATIVSNNLQQINYPIRTVNVPKLLLQNISLTLKPVLSVKKKKHNNNKMN